VNVFNWILADDRNQCPDFLNTVMIGESVWKQGLSVL
jgi:hypothetical protein